MSKRFKSIVALCSEHIVQGADNKPTLIGLYTGDIIVPHFPANIWMSFYIVLDDVGNLPEKVILKFFLGKEQFAVTEIPAVGLDPRHPWSIFMPSGILKIDRAAAISVIISGEGFADTKVLTKKVILQTANP